MANYINLINVGGTLYDIGMKNAVHFHGISKVSEFYNSAACTTHAGNTNIGDNYLWTKGLSIVINPDPTTQPSEVSASVIDEIHLGCMVILAKENGDATYYEYVCVEIISGEGTANQIAKWACMGETKTSSGTITTSVTTKTGDVAVGINTGKGSFVTSVTEDGVATAIKSDLTLSTASYTVITATPGTADASKVGVTAQTVASSKSTTSVNPVTNVTISDGSVIGDKVPVVTSTTYTDPILGTATVVTSVSHTNVSTAGGKVVTSVSAGGTITTYTGSVVTEAIGSVTPTAGSYVTSVSGGTISTTTGAVITAVSGGTITTSTGTVVTGVTGGTGSSTKGTVVTKVTGSPTTANVVTAYVNNSEPHTLVITGLSVLTGYTINTSTGSVVTDVSHTNISVGTGTIITKVTQSSLTVTPGTVVTKVTQSALSAPTAEAVASISTGAASKGTILTKVTQGSATIDTGTIVTSVSGGSLTTATGSVVTGITTAGSITVDTANVVNEVNYTKQELTVNKAGSITIVTNIGTTTVSVVTSVSDIAAVTSIPRADKTVATGFGTKNTVPVISGITVGTAQALNSVTLNTATITTGITQNQGSVLTAAV